MSYQVTDTQKNLRCVLLNERSQSEKALYCMIPTVMHSHKGKTVERARRSRVRGEGGRDEYVDYREFLGW